MKIYAPGNLLNLRPLASICGCISRCFYDNSITAFVFNLKFIFAFISIYSRLLASIRGCIGRCFYDNSITNVNLGKKKTRTKIHKKMTNKPKVKFCEIDKSIYNKHLWNGTSGRVKKQTQNKPNSPVAAKPWRRRKPNSLSRRSFMRIYAQGSRIAGPSEAGSFEALAKKDGEEGWRSRDISRMGQVRRAYSKVDRARPPENKYTGKQFLFSTRW
jgi:hypothetical protein